MISAERVRTRKGIARLRRYLADGIDVAHESGALDPTTSVTDAAVIQRIAKQR